MTTAPKELKKLVKRFHENRKAYLSTQYNETQLRREFLDPFFKALGWDVDNEQGYAEAYKDVIHEDAIKVGGATKAPDYAFRIGGTRKFFVEAKRPSVGIKDDPDAAYQLRRYAWSAKLPLSILTDFEEFAVYDCRVRPNKDDKASTARTFYFTFDEYETKWDEIAGIFAREAILKGSFDKYVETKKMRGTAEVDDAFLKEIEGWRDVLARNIALRNTSLSNREVNFAVQRTIDRIIFLRICEDRGIEAYGQLMALQNGQDVYRRLCQVFRNADDRYNSGLFHFREEKGRGESPDELTLNLGIDDRVLKDIFKDLYYPDSPYEFSVLPADILGHIYEQFLGKVIRLTAGHRAVVEEKPEVRKAGGVYYTPTYIVDYIVEHTVGKLLDGKTPNQVSKLHILDPACGSGSFLLGAYQRLLDWHLTWYSVNEPEKHAKGRNPKIFRGPGDDWWLTTAEKKRILLNNIYGVDIDPQAVEVTKLSLLLKVLEGESEETLGKTLRMFHERALPDLGENIKCGNSLIGPDFYEGKQLSLIDEEERYRINAFNWNAEFPEIMTAGGFDAVIGNPPYVGFHGFESEKPYLRAEYDSAQGRFDIYLPFIEKGMALLKERGVLGYICPTNFMKREHGAGLRRLLLERARLIEITDFEDVQVFQGATNYTGVFVIQKASPGSDHAFTYRSRDLHAPGFQVAQSGLSASPWIVRSAEASRVVSTVDGAAAASLDDLSKSIGEGVVTGCNDVFLLSAEDVAQMGLEKRLLQPLLRGKEISRYHAAAPSEYVIYPYYEDGEHTRAYTEAELAAYPSTFNYLVEHRKRLEERSYLKQTTKEWFELWRPRSLGVLRTRKIVTPELSSRNRFALLGEEILFGDTACGVVLEDDVREGPHYVLALLNSRLLSFYYRQTTVPKAGGYLIYKTMYLNRIPIKTIDFGNPVEAGGHAKLCHLAESMIALRLRVQSVKSRHSQDVTKREIAVTNKQIDQLVYELYGLTEKEIHIVEEGTRDA